MILVFIEKKFVNILAKSTIQFVLEKKENIRIIKIYHFNALPIVKIY